MILYKKILYIMIFIKGPLWIIMKYEKSDVDFYSERQDLFNCGIGFKKLDHSLLN